MINKLISNIRKTNAPIVVGLDPMLNYIPEHIQKKAFAEFGETLEGAAEAIWQYNKGIVDATCDLIPAVKPQIAMYEQFGIPGLIAYKKTVEYCKAKDLVVIGDIKRGDIGSTSAAYAVGHLGQVQVGSKKYAGFDEDFATVNPYLGSDGVKPFMDVCKEEKKGIFVLVKTSNPSSGEFQDRVIDGRPLYELVGEKVAQWGDELMGDGYSYVGAVVGATYPEMGKVLRKIMPKTFIPTRRRWCPTVQSCPRRRKDCKASTPSSTVLTARCTATTRTCSAFFIWSAAAASTPPGKRRWYWAAAGPPSR